MSNFYREFNWKTGQIWKHNNTQVFILGNAIQEDGTIWVANRRTGRSYHVPTKALTLVKVRSNADVVNSCIVWARKGNAAAAWWLGWYFEGTQHTKSIWYYITAMRKEPFHYGWAWSRVYADAKSVILCEGVPTPCIEFLQDIPEFNNRPSDGWQDAVSKAESAVDIPITPSHFENMMVMLAHRALEQVQDVAKCIGIPSRLLHSYEPFQKWEEFQMSMQQKASLNLSKLNAVDLSELDLADN
jgi:hypothetical protein